MRPIGENENRVTAAAVRRSALTTEELRTMTERASDAPPADRDAAKDVLRGRGELR